MDNSGEEGWGHIINTIGNNQKRSQEIKKQRPSPEQATLKEFEEDKMITPQQGMAGTNAMVRNLRPVQGNNKNTRGTQMTTVPTQPTQMLKPTQPIGGITPMGNDRGPMKMANDNVANNVNRKVQSVFNVGPNGTNNMTGLSNKTPMERNEINKHITAGIGGQSHSAYSGSPDYGTNGAVTRAFKIIGSFQGLEDDNHVGNGIDLQTMFQEMKPEKPTEVACSGKNKKEKFLETEK